MTTFSLVTIEDSDVYNYMADTVLGSSGILTVQDHNEKMKTYLKFDLAGVISYSKVELVLDQVWYGGSAIFFYVEAVSNAWSETSLTWNNNTLDSTVWSGAVAYLTVQQSTVRVDITDLIDEIFNTVMSSHAGIVTFRISAHGPGNQTKYTSKEHENQRAPYLEVIGEYDPTIYDPYWFYKRYVSSGDGNDGNDGMIPTRAWKTLDHAARNTPSNCTLYMQGNFTDEPVGNLIAPVNGNVKYVHRVTASSFVEINTAPDANTIDTALYSSMPDWAGGSYANIGFGSDAGWEYFGLLQFGVSAVNRPVTSATLRVWGLMTSATSINVRISRLTATFVEATATWNNTSNIAVSGYKEYLVETDTPQWLSFNVTDLINAGSGSTFGMKIERVGGDFGLSFTSKEGDPTHAPRLVIT